MLSQVTSKIKKRFPAESSHREIRPITTKLDKTSHAGLDLPHIQLPPQHLHRQQLHQQLQQQLQQQQPIAHLITSKLSRQLKLRGRVRRSSSISSLNENNNGSSNRDRFYNGPVSAEKFSDKFSSLNNGSNIVSKIDHKGHYILLNFKQLKGHKM
jgi:hypothetical protein